MRFTRVTIDCFTEWLEVEPLVTINEKSITYFLTLYVGIVYIIL